MKGVLDGRNILLGCIYAPNTEQVFFLRGLSIILSEWSGDTWLLGGVFNSVLDTTIDRSFPPLPRTTAVSNSRGLSDWLLHWKLTDIWRHRYANVKIYSFYSALHRLHVRIDRLVGTDDILPHVRDTDYMGRTHSDHNPQMLTLGWDRGNPPILTRRLQAAALENPPFRAALTGAVTNFFEANHNTATTRLIEWEAFKVTIRGHCLGTQWNMRHHIDAEIMRLERLLLDMESRAVSDKRAHHRVLERCAEHAILLERLKCLN